VPPADRPLEGSASPITLVSARVLNGEGALSPSPAWVSISDGRIVATGSGVPSGECADLEDALLVPGFLDVQVNGADDVDFASASVEDIVRAVDTMVARGTTGVLCTLCSAPLGEYDTMLQRLAEARAKRPDTILGVHLEGPFLGGAPGAHPRELILPADLLFLTHLCDAYGDLIRVVTLAPEVDRGGYATRFLTDHGIVVALGHSTIDFDGALAAAGAGARLVTHLFNGMGPLHHRMPGLPGAALTDARLVPSLIADFVHVHPAVVKITLDLRPDAVLVTDAVRADQTRLPDGTLAGSTLTMDQALRNVCSLDYPPARAVRYATGNPARVLGIADRGRIAAGARADIIALDPNTFEVRAVWTGGRKVAS
jgi:N-acetylglucosamine-6-phosphate deacetylase